MKRYFLLILAPLAILASCDELGNQTGPGTYTFFLKAENISAGSTTATIEAAYLLDPYAQDLTSEVGIRYSAKGETAYKEARATQLQSPFTVNITGLEPETVYQVEVYAKTSDDYTFVSPFHREFVTKAAGDPDPDPKPDPNPDPDPDPDPDPNPNPDPDPNPNPDPTPTGQKAWAELPVMKEMPDVQYVTHYADGKRNYTLCYDREKHQALWAAYPMHKWYDGSVGRNDQWRYDPVITPSYQPNLSSSYNKGQYSRGHQVASSDRQRSKAMNQQTFYYSNMVPQIQNEFNGGIWQSLEKKVQAWGFNCSDTLFVVTGGAFVGAPKTTTDKDGKTIPVPTHYYKVMISSKSGNTGKPISQLNASELRCVGFWLDHFGYGTKDKISGNEMTSVADIEEKTGFTFFPMLSEEAKSVKSTYNARDWGM